MLKTEHPADYLKKEEQVNEQVEAGQAQRLLQLKRYRRSDSLDYDDKITPEEELINAIKSNDSEEEKLESVRRLFEREIKPNLDFQDSSGDTALHIAVRKGEQKIVELFIEKRADVNVVDKDGRTPLHFAANEGKLDVVKLLIEKGADFKATDNNPLHLAAEDGNLDIVKYLVKRGADIRTRDKDDKTSLDIARRWERSNVIEYLEKKWNAYGNGAKAIHFAAEDNDVDAVMFNLDKEANPNEVDNNGWTPLHYAAKGSLDAARLLVERGANINAEDNFGKKPIHRAAEEGHRDIVEFLMRQGISVNELEGNKQYSWRRTPLHWAACFGHLDVVKFLVNRGADMNARDKDDKMPLDIARTKGYAQIVEFLSSIEHLNNELFDTVRKGNLDRVKDLIEKGADINSSDNDGNTPVHLAAKEGNLDVVKYLIEVKEVDLNAKDNNGNTPLHLATGEGRLDVVKYLIDEKKADFNVKNDDGWTPLHCAAEKGKLDVVKCLIDEKKADFNVKDNYGQTPLHAAAYWGNLDVVKYLIDEKKVDFVDFNVENNYGWTPLHRAAYSGNLDVVTYLVDDKKADLMRFARHFCLSCFAVTVLNQGQQIVLSFLQMLLISLILTSQVPLTLAPLNLL